MLRCAMLRYATLYSAGGAWGDRPSLGPGELPELNYGPGPVGCELQPELGPVGCKLETPGQALTQTICYQVRC